MSQLTTYLVRPASAPLLGLLGLSLALAGCQSTPPHDAGPRRIEAFVGWVEKVHVEGELAQHAVHEALDALGAIAAEDTEAEPVLAFGQFVAAIERSETRCAALREAVDGMEQTAAPLFTKWQQDLEAFSNERLRARSAERLAEKEQAWQELRAAVAPTAQRLTAMNKSLRDLALFLSHDLNESALQDLSGDLLAMQDEAAGIDAELRDGCSAALAYLSSAALPKPHELAPPDQPGSEAALATPQR